MANNPFDPKMGGLLGLGPLPVERPRNPFTDLLSPTPTPALELSPLARAIADALLSKPFLPVSPYPYSGAAADLFAPFSPPDNRLTGDAVADLFPTLPPTVPFGSLAGLYAPLPPPKPVAPVTKRKAFFSFHFDDIMRVNNVRQAWKIDHPDSASMRSFYDSSLWESRKIEGDEAVKRLIRAGVLYTSAVCVLAGTDTWDRRWVRYEIARAIIDGRGLLTVHLNSIRHHQTRTPHVRGFNPLAFMAVGKVQPDVWKPARYYLCERRWVANGVGGGEWEWHRYSDYTDPITLPKWVNDPRDGYVTPLSVNAGEYDYMTDNGHKNIGRWIDEAAQGAGR